MTSPESQPLRAVVDTNILVRGTLSSTGGSALVVEAIRRGSVVLVTSRGHLSELHRVLSRPRLVRRYGVTPRRRKRLISRLYLRSVLVNPTGQLQICRHPSDDPLIEAAILGRAGYLVSEDPDLYDDPDIVSLLRSHGVQLPACPASCSLWLSTFLDLH